VIGLVAAGILAAAGLGLKKAVNQHWRVMQKMDIQ
jgi:hypothetical protein